MRLIPSEPSLSDLVVVFFFFTRRFLTSWEEMIHCNGAVGLKIHPLFLNVQVLLVQKLNLGSLK